MAKYGDKTNSLSSLFGTSNAKGTGPSKFVASASLDNLGSQIESADYIRAELEDKQRLVPTVDFSKPANFAKYGSAKEYYKTSIERIYKTYPYDGSKKEKIQWSLSSSYLDNYIFENEWQTFRSKKNNEKLELKSSEKEILSKKTKVAVKIVDIFGNDTMKVIEVKL